MTMKWLACAILLLVIAIAFGMDLLAYAMYVLLAVIIVSRFLTRNWAESLVASRECNTLAAEIGARPHKMLRGGAAYEGARH